MSRYLYSVYDTQTALSAPARAAARLAADLFDPQSPRMSHLPLLRRVGAASRVIADARVTHQRPQMNISGIEGPDGVLAIRQEVADRTAFGSLLHFRAENQTAPRPSVLLVTPLSGHFSTLLAPTVRTLLRDNDVYMTDWHNARDIPLDEGRFGLDEYIDHVIRFLRVTGSDVHVFAVCQPCVPVLAAIAVLAEDPAPLRPRSLTLMAGPVDTRVNPNKINEMARHRSIEWFQRRCITVVPSYYPGAGRQVYPGFVQLSAFMSMNARRHADSHLQMYRSMVSGDLALATQRRGFYQEYFAVLDVAAEFYLETVERVFRRDELARGVFTHHGQPVDVAVITQTPLLTIEGERDDMCTPGQTAAAHDLLTGLSEEQHTSYVQPSVGHYGVFSGRRWDSEIYPVLHEFISANDRARRPRVSPRSGRSA